MNKTVNELFVNFQPHTQIKFVCITVRDGSFAIQGGRSGICILFFVSFMELNHKMSLRKFLGKCSSIGKVFCIISLVR